MYMHSTEMDQFKAEKAQILGQLHQRDSETAELNSR